MITLPASELIVMLQVLGSMVVVAMRTVFTMVPLILPVRPAVEATVSRVYAACAVYFRSNNVAVKLPARHWTGVLESTVNAGTHTTRTVA